MLMLILEGASKKNRDCTDMIACGPSLENKFRADACNSPTLNGHYAQRPFVFRLPVPLLVGLLTILPFVAHAERHLTYRCSGIESSDGGDIHTKVRIKRFYTLYVEDSGGRWFNWDEHMWYPIHSVSADEFHLAFDSDGRVSWTLSIERTDGAWNQVFAGGGGTTSTSGRCSIVRLRVPPHP